MTVAARMNDLGTESAFEVLAKARALRAGQPTTPRSIRCFQISRFCAPSRSSMKRSEMPRRDSTSPSSKCRSSSIRAN